ncbi:hypothetical protein Fmac_030723 [Flemingia macrophylla]|uniref:Maternal effect embryo arrest 22 n=1 Tax=Flemingia macrophylla TaxID=520843 RepID=A0ABD1L004_9FABA
MEFLSNPNHTLKSDSENPCCDHKEKYLKVRQSRNALRQAVDILKNTIKEIETRFNQAREAKSEIEGRLGEREKEICTLKELLGVEKGTADFERKKAAEVCELLENEKNKTAERDEEIGRLKELLEGDHRRVDFESKIAAEACKLLEEEKNVTAKREKEIGRLKGLLEVEKTRADSESKKAAEACKFQGEDKNKDAEMEKEISRLNGLLEAEKRRADSESKKAAEACMLLEDKNKDCEKEKEIGRLKGLLEVEKRRADSENKRAAEAWKLLGEDKNKDAEKEEEIAGLKGLLEVEKRRADSESKKAVEACKLLEDKNKDCEKEKEIDRLKGLLEAEKRRADSESNRAAEAWKLIGEGKNKDAEKKEEISRLKGLLEVEKRRADSESKKAAEACKKLGEDTNKASEKEKEFGRLKGLLEAEKRRADSESKKAAKAFKLLEEEKNKASQTAEIVRIEAEMTEKYKIQVSQLEKQVNEAKMKLVSEMSVFKEMTKKFEAEKRKILAEKRNTETEMAKVNERLEIEKQKVDEEKRLADAEMVNLEKQKALAEDNWNKFMKEKSLVDQMSQQLEENKQKIDNMKQKIDDLSSLRKPDKMESVKAENTKLKLLKNKLKLEKVRAKHTRQKYKLEASRNSILLHELGRIKIDFVQLLHRLDILDASFSPVSGSMHDQTKFENILDMQNSNVMRQICNLNLSKMRSQFENELLQPCCTTMDASIPLRKNMQCTPLPSPGENYSESITGIGSKLEPLVKGGSNRTNLKSSAVNSSTQSFSDGQLMGSQDATTSAVTASAKLSQEIFNAICNPSDKPVDVHHRKRKKMHDTVEYIAKLSSEKLSDLHGLLCREVAKFLEGGKEMLHNLNNLQEDNKRSYKKRKRSDREKVDLMPGIDRNEKKGTKEANMEVYHDVNVGKHTSAPAPHTLETTQACGERICDAANSFDSIININTVADGSYMKLLELEDHTSEECFRKALDHPLSPLLPEIEFHETFKIDNLMNPFLEQALQEGMLSSGTGLCASPYFDVMNVEINSNEQKLDDSGVSCNSHIHTTENSRTAFSVEDGIGSTHNQLPEFCIVFSNIKDNSIISRILVATKNCIARCNLATQTGWAVKKILTALKIEEKLSPKEKVSVLLTLLLFNFAMTATQTFGKLWDGKLSRCLHSYSEHICTVISDAETKIMFEENYPLHELLGLIEDFLIEGKIIVNNRVDAETSSCDLRANDFLECVKAVSSDVASREQLIAASTILASVCAATDCVGFISEASYHILRFCKRDSLMVLTILHIFAYLGGEKFFNMDNFGLMVTVLKSLIMFLEDGSLSAATACLPSIDELHAELCMNVKCPFLEGAESIDIVACLLMEDIRNSWLQGKKQVDLSDSRFVSDNYNAGQWYDQDAVQCAINKNCDVPCSEKCMFSARQPDGHKNNNLCRLNDVLSLVELVAHKMSWHWADMKLVPQLQNILNSCQEESFVISIIVLLHQLGRIGIDVGGYEDQGVGNLRCYLLAYFRGTCTSSMKASVSLKIAAGTALFGLLPLDFETLFNTNVNLPAYSKSVSDIAETLRKWFSELDKDQQKLLSGILKRTDVIDKALR